jgi:benzaldehyde dehydrogenase (NAD)
MTTTTEPAPPVAGHPWDGAIFDGTFRGAAGSITVTAPTAGQVIGRFGPAATSDLDRGVE